MIFATREDYEVELAFLDRFISSGSVAIDAGANCGIYTVAMAKLVGSSGRVIALEPGEQAGQTLQRNIELNGLDHVRLVRKALSDRDGSARLYHHGGPVGYSIAAGETEDGQSEEISSISLDSLLQQEGLDRVDLLKMDIEGAEELALRGAETMLTSSRPVIVFELNPSAAARFGLDTDGAWRHLKRFDYEFFTFDGAGKLCKLRSPPPEEQWEHCNIIAIHKDDHRSE